MDADPRAGPATGFAADRMILETAPVLGASFRVFFATVACPSFAATDFCCPGFAAGLFAGCLALPARADLSVAKVRRVFFDIFMVY
jgi:hypothetical protein